MPVESIKKFMLDNLENLRNHFKTILTDGFSEYVNVARNNHIRRLLQHNHDVAIKKLDSIQTMFQKWIDTDNLVKRMKLKDEILSSLKSMSNYVIGFPSASQTNAIMNANYRSRLGKSEKPFVKKKTPGNNLMNLKRYSLVL